MDKTVTHTKKESNNTQLRQREKQPIPNKQCYIYQKQNKYWKHQATTKHEHTQQAQTQQQTETK